MSEKVEKPDVKVALATFNERLIAALIDYGIYVGVIIVGIILQVAISYVPIVGGWLSWLLGLVLYAVGIAAMFFISIWMPYKKDGQSIGKKNQNIKIMFIDDEAKWTLRPVGEGDLGNCAIRGIIGWIEAGIVFGLLAWYFITNDKNRQRFADKLGKTVVVQCDPETGEPLKKPREITKK
ncbi:MAG: RDD family protein [Asgard group archaeon]|nr:RDD family protein [Asgard group archaeon]